MYVVEISSYQHVDDIVHLAKDMHKETMSHLPFIDEMVRARSEQVIEDQTIRKYLNVWIVYSQEDVPCGFIVGCIHQYFFNTAKFAQQELWFVKKEYRKNGAALKLMKAFEKWAKEMNVLQIYTGVAHHEKEEAERIGKLFPKMGYEHVGSYYLKEINEC